MAIFSSELQNAEVKITLRLYGFAAMTSVSLTAASLSSEIRSKKIWPFNFRLSRKFNS